MFSTRTIANRMPQMPQAQGASGDTVFMLTLLSGVPHADIERYLRHSPLLAKLADDLRSIERRLSARPFSTKPRHSAIRSEICFA